MKHKFRLVSVFTIILCLCSCGNSDYGGGGSGYQPPQQQEDQPPFAPENFQTRLNATLAVNGTKCNGGERPDENKPEETCSPGEWLIQLDDENTCTSDLATCTEISVRPIIAQLDLNQTRSNAQASYYVIDPKSSTTARQRSDIRKVLIRTQSNGDTEAIER
jgi:hypothetical protein